MGALDQGDCREQRQGAGRLDQVRQKRDKREEESHILNFFPAKKSQSLSRGQPLEDFGAAGRVGERRSRLGGVFKIFEVKEETRRLTLEEETKCGRISEISAEMKRSGKENGK